MKSLNKLTERITPYSNAHFTWDRIPAHEVKIGHLPIGGTQPIRIQSMTTTNTMDTHATVEQTIRLVKAGCEYVRITAPSRKEAENLAEIKKQLRARGYDVPLIADIHYTPNAAEIAARIVEKVRVNPGNYVDKKRFKTIEYDDFSYQAEIDRIYKRFSPLVKICKEYGTAMRIGTNHGSLSDRIMSRYGDTPLGMVESAMEFVRICESHGFHNLVLSMKASNPQIMVQAYRLLVQYMMDNGRIYPLHLGVTEAGEGEDGRIKSALGIGTLLMEGLGDTVRVSLTEEPEHESPVAHFIVDHYLKQINTVKNQEAHQQMVQKAHEHNLSLPFNPYAFNRQATKTVLNTGLEEVPRVISDIRHNCMTAGSLKGVGYDYNALLDKYNFSDIASDFVYLGDRIPAYELPGGLKVIYNASTWQLLKNKERYYPYFASINAFLNTPQKSKVLNIVEVGREDIDLINPKATDFQTVVFLLRAHDAIPTYEWRYLRYRLAAAGLTQPVWAKQVVPHAFDYYNDSHLPEYVQIDHAAKTQLNMSLNGSTMLVDGLLDGIWIEQADALKLRAVFGTLQLSRLRITKTEYISCPSCGRTLFDLQETTARIRARTEHLKGVKIGIMGCIVNGPGEMADADYGYVGTGVGKISLYRGQQVVKKGVKTVHAVNELIELIKSDGKWVDP